MTEVTSGQEPTFAELGLSPKLVELLEKKGFTIPSPIQHKAIPIALAGEDVIGIAQTGTGKTMAFGLPMIQSIGKTKGKGLILLPTRELALQVDESLQNIGRSIGLRTAVLIGGAAIHLQKQALKRDPHIVIATPGRLNDHLTQTPKMLHGVTVLVLDEADRMLDMGFAPQIKTILQSMPQERHTMLFSATMPAEIVGLARSYMKNPVHVEIARAGTTAELIDQEFYIVGKSEKDALLEKLITDTDGTTLVFSRTKYGAKNICGHLRKRGYSAAEIHSNRSLAQRKEALQGFKNGKYRVLVATDIAARGIDVTDISLVINYDLPESTEDYVHRIGRTGRAGKKGKAISFAKPDQKRDIIAIERLIQKSLTLRETPRLPKVVREFTPDEEPSHGRSSRFSRGRAESAPRGRSDAPRTGSGPARSPRPPLRGGQSGFRPRTDRPVRAIRTSQKHKTLEERHEWR